MLTVKNVDPFGWEEVCAGTSVRSRPVVGSQKIGSPEYVVEVERSLSEGGTKVFTIGKVFVMNDVGKTVATYDLGYDGNSQAALNATYGTYNPAYAYDNALTIDQKNAQRINASAKLGSTNQ